MPKQTKETRNQKVKSGSKEKNKNDVAASKVSDQSKQISKKRVKKEPKLTEKKIKYKK